LEARDVLAEAFGAGNANVGRTTRALVRLYRATGREEEAIEVERGEGAGR
jgi:hypothetical protein